jgi:predicted SnoaL-like aldol condensation-catalyzing enzyme
LCKLKNAAYRLALPAAIVNVGYLVAAPGRAIFDCFRFDEYGKVVEHWDAIQDVPVKASNPNGMF